MSLILVVDPDSRHAAHVASMARKHLKAEFVTADSGFRALEVLADRVPDIVLTAPLLPGRDEAVLSDYLRGLGDAGAHVQTLTIPILSAASAPQRSVRGRFRRTDRSGPASDGCDPEVFAEQVSQYLQRANQSRRVVETEPTLAVGECDVALMSAPVVDDDIGDDIDLTPFLADLAEPAAPDPPAPPARFLAPLPVSRITLPPSLAPVVPSRATPPPPPASVVPSRPTFPPSPSPVALSRATPEPSPTPVVLTRARPEPSPTPVVLTSAAPAPSPTPVVLTRPTPAPPAPVALSLTAPQPSSARVVEPEVVEAEPPAPTKARRADATDALIVGGGPADREPAAPTQHLITLPAMIGDGQPGHAHGSVSVAVAVSVQVATSVAPAAPAAKRRGRARPVQDEWGFFDPDQCGFRALLARLDAIADTDDPE